MKVLYLTIGDPGAGVGKKLMDKINFLQAEGLEIELCIVSDKNNASEGLSKIIPVSYRLARWLDKWPLLWRMSVVAEQWYNYSSLKAFLTKRSFDFIIFRYPVADYFLWRFTQRLKNKIVFEHNTIETRELAIRKSTSFYYRYFYYGEKTFGKRVRENAAGIIGVTAEITNFQLGLIKKTIPNKVISNGINVDRVPLRTGSGHAKGTVLNMLLLAGSEAPWHGVDMVLKSLSEYNGQEKVHCYIAGNISQDQKNAAALLSNITVLPGQTGEALNQLVDQCHVGIGSMGLSDHFLTQACPLKVREYWARGLPFIIGYDDTDLAGFNEMEKFYLRVRGKLSIGDLISFAREVYSKSLVAETMRALAYKKIHYAVRAKDYLSFLNQIKE